MSSILLSSPTLLWSDDKCKLDGRFYKRVPLLLDTQGKVIDAASDWLRTQTVSGKTKPSSVEQYAYTLRSFWQHLHKRKVPWANADDSVLRTWRNEMYAEGVPSRNKGLERRSINHKLHVVLHFYIWAQHNSYIVGVVGQNRVGERRYPIALEEVVKRGHIVNKSTVLFRITRKPRNPIPNRNETTKLFSVLARAHNPFSAERNCLMAKWVLAAGLRRCELLSLKADMLPSIAITYEAENRDGCCDVTVVGKGGHTRTVPVPPSLVIETWDYLDGARQEVVERCGLRRDDGFLFISTHSGKPLNPQYVSRLFSRAFSFSNRKLSLQRLRARFTSLLVRYLREEEQARSGLAGLREETILFRAAELLGHKDTKSLHYYLNLDLDAEWRLVSPVSNPENAKAT